MTVFAEAPVAPDVSVCDAVRPDMIEAFSADGAARLCDARRAVLGCGGCACAALSEVAEVAPDLRAALGQEVRDIFVQGGAQ